MIHRFKYLIGVVLLAFFISACSSESELNKEVSDDTVEIDNHETDDTQMESGADTQSDNESDIRSDSESDIQRDSESGVQLDSESDTQLDLEGDTVHATVSDDDHTMEVDKENEELQDINNTSAIPPADYLLKPLLLCLMETADHRRKHMTVSRMVIVIRPIKISRHDGDIIRPILAI